MKEGAQHLALQDVPSQRSPGRDKVRDLGSEKDKVSLSYLCLWEKAVSAFDYCVLTMRPLEVHVVFCRTEGP